MLLSLLKYGDSQKWENIIISFTKDILGIHFSSQIFGETKSITEHFP